MRVDEVEQELEGGSSPTEDTPLVARLGAPRVRGHRKEAPGWPGGRGSVGEGENQGGALRTRLGTTLSVRLHADAPRVLAWLPVKLAPTLLFT